MKKKLELPLIASNYKKVEYAERSNSALKLNY